MVLGDRTGDPRPDPELDANPKHGVPFYKYVLLPEADDPEEDLCEYEQRTQANIAANRKKLEELGLL